MGFHSVPQYYLKGFSDSTDSAYIWRYEKGKNISNRIPIQNVASEKKRWPKKIEEYLSQQIEDPAKPVLDKIRNFKTFTKEDKIILSAYMVVMLNRVDKGLERVSKIALELIPQGFDHISKHMNQVIQEHPEKKVPIEKQLAELPTLKSKFEKEFPRAFWQNNLTPRGFPQIMDVFGSMTWILLTSQKQHTFITNDNPIFYFEGLGLDKPESQVIFPISSNIVLLASWNTKRKQDYYNVRESVVKQINKRIASVTSRYAFHSQNDPGIISLINKKDWEFKRLT